MTPRTLTPLLALAVLIAAPCASAVASTATVTQEDDRIVLANTLVTLRFEDKLPDLNVTPTGADAGFGLTLVRILEFRDVDGDGLPSETETLATFDLQTPEGLTTDLVETDTFASVNLTRTGDVRLPGPLADAGAILPGNRTATVSLTFTLHDADAEMDADAIAFEVPATAAKWDLAVLAWPWVDASDGRLALETHVSGTLNATDVEDAPGAAVMDAEGHPVGAIAWTPEANATGVNGTSEASPVKTHIEPVENATRLVFAYEGSGYATLVHTQSVGVPAPEETDDEGPMEATSGLRDVPAPGLALAAAAVGVAAWATRRRP